jgi:signal transduction histidine kinase
MTGGGVPLSVLSIYVIKKSTDMKGGEGAVSKYLRIMKDIPVDTVRGSDLPWVRGKRPRRRGAAARQWHSVTVSCSPPDATGADAVLELSFAELVRYYRHSSVGRRCLGLVHQMNTPLQVISFQLDLLEQKTREEWAMPTGSSLAGTKKLMTRNQYCQEKLRQMRRELDKLENFTRSLALQGRHEDSREKLPLDLNQLWRQELEFYLTQPFFKHRVTKDFHFEDGLPLYPGYYIDFSQSLRNLIDNALEAMEGVDCPRLTVVTASRDRGVILRIGDTGVGIPPVDLSWIFEPFFTTKRTAHRDRSGLGLFMVRRLLGLYRAEIRVDSVPGETWVSLWLPPP